MAVDDKRDARFAPRQALILLLLAYCYATTLGADFPVEASDKWDWVWTALAFAVFLTLREVKRRMLYLSALALIGVTAVPFLHSG